MIKIWLLVAFMSSPEWPSVRTQAFVYPTEGTCVQAQVDFFNFYEMQPEIYRKTTLVAAPCSCAASTKSPKSVAFPLDAIVT